MKIKDFKTLWLNIRIFICILPGLSSFNSMAQTPTNPYLLDDPFYEVNQQLRGIFSGLNRPSSNYNFLYDMSGHVLDETSFSRFPMDTIIHPDKWFQHYEETFAMAYDTNLVAKPDDVSNQLLTESLNGIIPIAIRDINFYKLKPDALTTGTYFDFDTVNTKLTDVATTGTWNPPYTEKNAFYASPIFLELKSQVKKFKIDPAFIYADGTNLLKYQNGTYSIRIDFGDGTGPHIFPGNAASIHPVIYPIIGGISNIITEILEDGVVVKKSVSQILNPSSIPITPPDRLFSYSGLNVGVFEPCNADPNNRKIVIVLEGIDILENKDAGETYQELIKDTRIANLKNYGYSFYVVDWHNSRQDMRNNVSNVVSLIDYLKQYEISSTNKHPFVLIGHSMGGVIGRYALRYMETSAYTSWNQAYKPERMHNTRLFISLDAPHQGANIPLAIQHSYGFITNSVPGIWGVSQKFLALRNNWFLDGAAAKQLLIYHYEARNPLTWKYSSHFLRTSFMNDLNALGNNGYPEFCKKVAYASGSMDGLPLQRYYDNGPRQPNDRIWDFTTELYGRILGIKIPVFGADVDLKTNPNGGVGTLVQINAGAWSIRVKFRIFGVKLITGYNTLFNISVLGKDLQPYCTQSASTLSSVKQKKLPGNWTPCNIDNRVYQAKGYGFPFVSLNSCASANGCYNNGLALGWKGLATAHFDMNFCSDGFEFGFIPTHSALDYGSGLNAGYPINNDGATAILAGTPFDVVVGVSGGEYYANNLGHLTIKKTETGASPLYDVFNCTNADIYGNYITREIGDDVLYLNNMKVNWDMDFEAELNIFTDGIPNSSYLSNTLPSSYSKNAPFISTDYTNHFVNFTYGNSMSGTLNSSWVNGTNYTAAATYSRTNCCRDYFKNLKRGNGKHVGIDKTTNGKLLVYPNPNNTGTLHIESSLLLQENVKIKVMDITGKIITETRVTRAQDNTEINIENLAQGIYMIEISNDKEKQIQKLIIN